MAKEKKKFEPKDTLCVFVDQEILYLDFQKDTWALGDIKQIDQSIPFVIPENASIIKFGKDVRCEHSNAFVTGGVDKAGNILKWAFGIRFDRTESDGLQDL